MSNARTWIFKTIGIFSLWLALPGGALALPETNAPAAEVAGKSTDASASNDMVRAYLQLHEQIREAQAAIERIRRESEEAASRNADALATRLQAIESSVATQRDAMQSTGKFMLVVLSIFAGAGFVGIVLTAYFQWRTVNRLAEFSASVPALRPFGLLPAAGNLSVGENHPVSAAPVEESNARLVGAIDRLEKRIHELEHATQPPLHAHALEMNGGHDHAPLPLTNAAATEAADAAEPDPDRAAEIKRLLEEGQGLLNQNKAEEAVKLFDDALDLDSQNTEALVKKGTALEKLRKLQEAIECYDRAITIDGSMTIAYLYKGGLYNRLERFSEAVECYEQALRTQEKRAA